MKTYLKVKIKALGAEAKIIKHEERKWLKVPFYDENVRISHPLYIGLRNHRLYDLRKECRHSHIAYGWMRGRKYKQIENKCHEEPNWSKVARIINAFSQGKYSCAEEKETLKSQLEIWAKF